MTEHSDYQACTHQQCYKSQSQVDNGLRSELSSKVHNDVRSPSHAIEPMLLSATFTLKAPEGERHGLEDVPTGTLGVREKAVST